jgi:aspartyl-tRNA(Asn)/glutamyl-tRNA(Gln) amidotransferase subunit A
MSQIRTISETASLIERKQLSPVELTRLYLERIETHNKQLNAYITILAEEALNEANQAESEIMKGNYRGPLHGIPIALKDLVYTKGVRTTSGSAMERDFIPAYDATVAAKFKHAGAILLGKLNMHEFAFGATSLNEHYGHARNPWDTERMTGGSSGGSGAAVASGLAMAAIGTDTGGSIRTPSSLCGIVGLKPTFGRVSKYGVTPLSWSLDHVGPMVRSVKDAAIVLQVIAGYDELDQTTVNEPVEDYASLMSKDRDLKGVRIGIPQNYFYDAIDPEVDKAIKSAVDRMASLGAEVIPVSIPELELSMFAEMVTICAEASAYHHEQLISQSQRELYGADVRILLESGELLTAVQYIKAQQTRRLIQGGFLRQFAEVDILVAPTLPFTAPKLNETHVMIGGTAIEFTMECVKMAAPANLAGIPSLSIPIGLSSAGLPMGMQLLTKAFHEKTLLKVGGVYELTYGPAVMNPPGLVQKSL